MQAPGDRTLVFNNSLTLAVVFALSATAAPSAQSPAPRARGDSAALERTLLDAVQHNPDSFDARHRLAMFYLQAGKIRAALPHLQRAAAINPSDYEVGYDLARALLETDRLGDARLQVKPAQGQGCRRAAQPARRRRAAGR